MQMLAIRGLQSQPFILGNYLKTEGKQMCLYRFIQSSGLDYSETFVSRQKIEIPVVITRSAPKLSIIANFYRIPSPT